MKKIVELQAILLKQWAKWNLAYVWFLVLFSHKSPQWVSTLFNRFRLKVTSIQSLHPFLICSLTFLHVPPPMTRDSLLSSLKWIVFFRNWLSRFLFISQPEKNPLGVPVKHRCFMFLKCASEAWLCFPDQGRVRSSTIKGCGFEGNVEVKMGSLGWKKIVPAHWKKY